MARIQLNEKWIIVDEESESLASGMAVTAEIKTGRRTIMDYLLSPLFYRASESLRER